VLLYVVSFIVRVLSYELEANSRQANRSPIDKMNRFT
jgi:hypothetical protein